MTHTKEPWVVVEENTKLGWYIQGGSGFTTSLTLGEADARRIVACVNALAGIPTEKLERGVVGEMVARLREAGLELELLAAAETYPRNLAQRIFDLLARLSQETER